MFIKDPLLLIRKSSPLDRSHLADPLKYSSQCSTTDVTKAVVCAIISVNVYKRSLAADQKRVAQVMALDFLLLSEDL